MKRKLFFCTKNFENFPSLNITSGDIDVETEIKDEEVILNVNYPLGISDGKSSVFIEDFSVELPVRLGMLYDSASEFVDKSSVDGICLSCILDISLRNSFYVDMFDYDDETVLFIFRDEESVIANEPFRFIFANKYLPRELEELEA